MSAYPPALALTLGLEVPVVALVYRGQRARMAGAAACATTATHLTMHFALPALVASRTAWLVTGEVFALVAEAFAYWALARSRGAGIAMVASAMANTLSFAAGLVLL